MESFNRSRWPVVHLVIHAASVGAACVISLGTAQTADARPAAGGRPARPPAAAIDACNTATNGQARGFTLPDGSKLSGTCGAASAADR